MVSFRLFGVPVSIHASSILVLAFLGWGATDGVLGMVQWFLVAWTALLIHEGGHALAYGAFGHGSEIEILGLGGLTRSTGGPRLKAWQQLMVSLAGPVAGFVAAALTFVGLLVGGLTGLLVTDPEGLFATFVVGGLSLFLAINLIWGVFNLLPVLPLDGGQAMQSVFRMRNPLRAPTWARMVSAGVAALVAALSAWAGMTLTAVFFAMLFLSNVSAPDIDIQTR